MGISYINTGTGPNAGNGDPIRVAFNKINDNFLYITSSSSSTFVSVTVSALSAAGLVVNNSSGTLSSVSSVSTATTSSSFSATHRVAVTIGTSTYYIPCSHTPW